MSEATRFNDQENRLRRVDNSLEKPLAHSAKLKPSTLITPSRFKRVPLGSKNSNNSRPGLEKAITSLDPSSLRLGSLVSRPPSLLKSQSLLGIPLSSSNDTEKELQPLSAPLEILAHTALTELGPQNALRDSRLVERHLVTDNLCKPDISSRMHEDIPSLRSTFSANTAALSASNIPNRTEILEEPIKRQAPIPSNVVRRLEMSDYALDLATGSRPSPSYRPQDAQLFLDEDMHVFFESIIPPQATDDISKDALTFEELPLDFDLPMNSSRRIIPASIDNLGLTEDEMLDLLD